MQFILVALPVGFILIAVLVMVLITFLGGWGLNCYFVYICHNTLFSPQMAKHSPHLQTNFCSRHSAFFSQRRGVYALFPRMLVDLGQQRHNRAWRPPEASQHPLVLLASCPKPRYYSAHAGMSTSIQSGSHARAATSAQPCSWTMLVSGSHICCFPKMFFYPAL